MDRSTKTGNTWIRRSAIPKLEGDSARGIDEHFNFLLIPTFVQSVGEFFVDPEIWKAIENLGKAVAD
ncbi:MAG: hypothetical protein QOI53_869, partial [Verrucomicrobiota bacterium]|nr:hypothetical protein [Verrucomicrobiota bacterium]